MGASCLNRRQNMRRILCITLIAIFFGLPNLASGASVGGDQVLYNSEGGISSGAADGKHRLNISNSGAETFTEVDGDVWYRKDTNIWFFYDGAEWDWFITNEAVEGNTETGITVTAQADGTIDFVTDVIQAEVDAKLALTGGTMTGAITLNDDASLKIDATPDGMADDKYNGITITGLNFGETVGQWACVFLAADGKLDIADADAAGEYPALGIVVAGGDDTDPAIVLVQGVVRNEGWTGLTVGGAVYLGDGGAGAITQTAPSTTDDCVQAIGRALSDSEIYFNFTMDYFQAE